MSEQERGERAGQGPFPGPGWDLGGVEEEAQKLVEAARIWLRTQRSGGGGGGGGRGSDPWADLTDDPAEPDAGAPRAEPETSGEPEASPAEEPYDAASARASRAGSEGHEPCTDCPWCRAKAAAGGAGAGVEALEGLADVLDSAAVSLRAFAAHRRHAGGRR